MTSNLEAAPDASQELLFRLASGFRLAIVRCSSKSGLASLHDFPNGACSDASLLLAKHLQVMKCGLSHYVFGVRQGQPHAWLELLEYTIDITADQFQDQEAGVIVSRGSSWHESFNGKIYGVADFCLYDRSTVIRLTKTYEEIIAVLR